MPAHATDLSAARERIAAAYDPAAFEAAGIELIETLAAHFRRRRIARHQSSQLEPARARSFVKPATFLATGERESSGGQPGNAR